MTPINQIEPKSRRADVTTDAAPPHLRSFPPPLSPTSALPHRRADTLVRPYFLRSSTPPLFHSSALPLLLAALLTLLPLRAQAHEGPPFPILTDQRVGPYVVSVWSDPDIGTGTFFVVLEPAEGEAMREPAGVRIGVAPVSGRLPEVLYTAEPQRVREGGRYFTEVAFDQGELWNVRVLIDGPGGGELRTQVEATPDGTIGPVGLLVYALPFLAVGFLWLKAFLRHRRTSVRQAP